MDIQFKKIISLFFAAVSICICVICTSCSDTMVEMPVMYPKIIYSYSAKEAAPDAVLSIYSQVTDEAVRLSSMTVQHNASGLSWYVKPLSVMKDSRGTDYAGCSSLKMPEGEKFPTGLYTIIFKDYAGNTEIQTFTLEDTYLERMPEKAEYNRKFIVYDKSENVLYISADDAETSDTVESLSSRYPKGESVREYISDIRKKAVYILPEESLRKANE